jgi:hypothetical protein
VAGTDSGDLLYFYSGEYKCHLSCLNGNEYPVISLVSFALGFIVGSSKGVFLFIHFDPDHPNSPIDEQFNLARTIQYEAGIFYDILHMSLSMEEDGIAALTANNQILFVPIHNPTTLVHDDIKMMQTSFHGPKSIQGMDVCLKKPLIITCSKDNTLRIWNFLTNEIEMTKVKFLSSY